MWLKKRWILSTVPVNIWGASNLWRSSSCRGEVGIIQTWHGWWWLWLLRILQILFKETKEWKFFIFLVLEKGFSCGGYRRKKKKKLKHNTINKKGGFVIRANKRNEKINKRKKGWTALCEICRNEGKSLAAVIYKISSFFPLIFRC